MTKPFESYDYFTTHVLPFTGKWCLIWPYARHRNGYGVVLTNKSPHRLACAYKNGEAPSPTHQAAHTCGKGHLGCVNPMHLEWRTPLENTRDKVSHGTQLYGEAVPKSVLTAAEVLEIFSLRGIETQLSLATRYGVKREAISKIQLGKRWRHLGLGNPTEVLVGRPPRASQETAAAGLADLMERTNRQA